MKWLAACGIVMLVLDVGIMVLLSAIDPEYSHARQYISELGEDGRPYATLFNVWSVVYGLLFAGFAVSLGRGLKSTPVLIACLAIAACCIVTGTFPCDPGCKFQTPTAKVHLLSGYVSLPATILASLFAWFAMQRSAVWRGYRSFTLATTVLLSAGAGWLAICHFLGYERERCAVGIAQRLIVGVLYLWLIAVAIRLWQLADKSSPGTSQSSDALG